ncbi:hypothetical protein [Xanthomonas sp. 3058]|uniref:hypothetical protein n=1 Tax=Xanthomonas sp. 3058 TaxID=3035314 RepID=UPI00160AF36E|nr:hypothetical protein [Xanthomonas sp. 3058]MBB5862842.1 hypothetical protein [Xanthomonas sp. 3058]
MGFSTAKAAEVACPPDVYSAEYEDYLREFISARGFAIEPLVYGRAEDITRLSSKFSELSIGRGVVFVLSDLSLSTFYVADCDTCGPASYQALMAQCAAKLGTRCIEFAVVIDGTAQCLLIPRPEI